MEEHRLRVFENRELTKIFGPNRDWRKLHNEELNNLYSSPNIIRMIKKFLENR
jgi:acyl-coenzyme A synthetase/AMP-(fatty) acid ligase